MVVRAIEKDRHYTADEYMKIVGSDLGWELIEGKIEPVCAAAWNSSRVTTRLAAYLSLYVETRGLGFVWVTEASFRLRRDPDTVVQPDVAFVRPERMAGQVPDTYFAGSPDLAVEVRSPSDRMASLHRKMTRYLEAGSQVTWLVDPLHRQVHVRRQGEDFATVLEESDVLTVGELIPGLELPIVAVFDTVGPIRPELVLSNRS